MLECISQPDPKNVQSIQNSDREGIHLKFFFESSVFKYQENPVLLDPILPNITGKIFDSLESEVIFLESTFFFKLIYLIYKILLNCICFFFKLKNDLKQTASGLKF